MHTTTEPEAVRFWSFFWEEASRVIDEASEILGRQLREAPVSLRNVSRDPWRGAGELCIGHTVLRLEAPFVCLKPGPREPRLAEVFGETPLAWIFVYRETRAAPHLLAWIAADPVRRQWMCSELDFGPVRIDDVAMLEAFLWGILADARA